MGQCGRVNGIEFAAFFINLLMACTALPMTEQRIGGEHYQVQHWVCQSSQGPLTVRSWRRPCDTGHTTYWGRMIFLEFEELHTEIYVNRFGEVMVGQGARLEEAYQTACGS
jgi:hypothetical protein